MKKIATVFSGLELLGLGLWVGGMSVIGGLVAPVVFGELGANPGGDVMSIVFRRFNGGFVYACIVLSAVGFIGKFLLARRPGRARGIEAGLLAVMIVIGLYIGAVLGPQMQELRQEKIVNPSDDNATHGFTRDHHIAEDLFGVNLALGIVLLFFNGREIVRPGEA